MTIDHRPPPAPVLLVEDDPRDAELALNALAAAGLPNPVVHAGDGAGALDYLLMRGNFADRPPALPALVILDLGLPRVDGLEVLATIRARPELRPLPVIVLTSSAADSRRIQAHGLGVNFYVVKTPSYDGLGALAMQLTSAAAKPGRGRRAGARRPSS